MELLILSIVSVIMRQVMQWLVSAVATIATVGFVALYVLHAADLPADVSAVSLEGARIVLGEMGDDVLIALRWASLVLTPKTGN